MPSLCYSCVQGVLRFAPTPPRSLLASPSAHPATLRSAPPLRSGSLRPPLRSGSFRPRRAPLFGRGTSSRPETRCARRLRGLVVCEHGFTIGSPRRGGATPPHHSAGRHLSRFRRDGAALRGGIAGPAGRGSVLRTPDCGPAARLLRSPP